MGIGWIQQKCNDKYFADRVGGNYLFVQRMACELQAIGVKHVH